MTDSTVKDDLLAALPSLRAFSISLCGRTARAGKSGICMSIVSPKQISNIRQIERLVKQKFHKSDIPDGAEVVRKKLFFYLEQIANAQPQADFAKLYKDSIHEQFAEVDKDELIRKLIEYKKFKEICEELRPLEEERLKQERRGNIPPKYGRSSARTRIRETPGRPQPWAKYFC